MPATTLALELDSVVCTYPDGYEALHGVSLTVADGEILALLGPSGSGKSSLLRAVAGLEAVTSGRVLIHGKDMAGVPPHKRGCGMVFQDGQLFPYRSVGRNVAYGLEWRGHSKEYIAREVARWLDLVGLHGFENRAVTTLSGGQAQRAALARSLAAHPELLLLDEPLSALDRDLRERLSVELRSILKAANAAAVYVTHDHHEARTVADRIALMDDGRITD
ncbi:MAG: ABC transporter ATP-binding protein [Ancrocorticia sp.]|jgi:thiamine transport system ATP-binding protein|nr:ABC transporter ATP-binding protein [Ancrocorticia sp.]MCI1932530.1 ABC transporter ATP-binding protein [Ancrocorticia sp.]MCI1963718.1 ABC transporter ATP-binding protein [Ancrocorticia sp.]MCI2003041.1 ABC transporter ATP-binding protein [Ancrocorticia sp.]MCI2012013.1 ABC transporter ATP-binding protein [Ancrocorticia sp.]